MTKERAYELREYFEDGSERNYFYDVTGDYYITERTAPKKILDAMREEFPKAFEAKGLIGYSLYRIGKGYDGDRNEIYAPEFGCEQLIYIPVETI